jgi:PilZ domain
MKSPSPTSLRRSVRVQVRVPVIVSGTFPGGSPFRQEAQIVTVSKYGAKVRTSLPLDVGTELKIQPRGKREGGKFKVVWVGREDSPRAGEIGVEYIQVSNLLGVTFPE